VKQGEDSEQEERGDTEDRPKDKDGEEMFAYNEETKKLIEGQ
jgi:hypothetical protein